MADSAASSASSASRAARLTLNLIRTVSLGPGDGHGACPRSAASPAEAISQP